MFRKIVRGISAFALVCVAFAIYLWQDETFAPARRPAPPTSLRPMERSATQPADNTVTGSLTVRGARISPGHQPTVHVYDPRTGEARIVMQATRWQPVSDTQYQLTEPSARVLLPGGQLAYVRADEGYIHVAGDEKGNVDPKRGVFRGHVRVVLDLTTPQWRRQNPDLAEPENHPAAVVKIWLDDARFDLDLARLESSGKVLVESSRGTIEGTGLELSWSELDRRLKRLRILKGERATLRGPGLDQFGTIPGNADVMEENATATRPATGAFIVGVQPPPTPPPPATQPDSDEALVQALHEAGLTVTTAPADPATTEGGTLGFLEAPRGPGKDRIDTYRVVFRDGIVARQINGVRGTGELRADVLTVLADFGDEERQAMQYMPGTQPAADTDPSLEQREKPAARADAGEETSIDLRWTGEVLLEAMETPATREADESGDPRQRRFHLTAEGNPVVLHDARQGQVLCGRLEYHLENRRVWLTALPGRPVRLNSGAGNQVEIRDRIFLDYPGGLAMIEGPGRMVRFRSERSPENLSPALPADAPPGSEGVTLGWQRRAELRFERIPVAEPASARQSQAPGSTGDERRPSPGRGGVYLRHAIFEGEVLARMPTQAVEAGHVEIFFLSPQLRPGREAASPPAGSDDLLGGELAAEKIIAAGKVRLTQEFLPDSGTASTRRREIVTCERLEVDMTMDEAGRNLPLRALATGQVLARQVSRDYLGPIPTGPAQVRDIHAGQSMAIEMASVPRPPTPEEQRQWETIARQRGLTPDSPQWKAKETELRQRRQIILTRLTARGDVRARDTRQNLRNLVGRELECSFDAAGQIKSANVVGWPDRDAVVDHDTFYIRGRQLFMDMTAEVVQVPGKGRLRWVSQQDIDGQPLDKPTPVIVTWEQDMWLHGRENVGSFSGQVRVTSRNTVLEAPQLKLHFAEAVPQTAPARSQAQRSGLRALFTGGSAQPTTPGTLAGRRVDRPDKRLARIDTVGETVVVSSAYEDPLSPRGRIVPFLVGLVPESWRTPQTRPASVVQNPGRGRLLSRIRLTGPSLRVDLEQERMIITGEGSLLIEDYRLPRAGSARPAGEDLLTGGRVPGLEVGGPSQTLFTWRDSMTFLNKSNIAVFDGQVVMRHRAGADMVLAGQLEAALRLDEHVKKSLRSRTASLTCDHLRAEFERQTAPRRRAPADSTPLSRATGLAGFRAAGNVYLVDSDGKVRRSAAGGVITYSKSSGIADIIGSGGQPATIEEVDVRDGRLNAQWRGTSVQWNLNTGVVTAAESRILR